MDGATDEEIARLLAEEQAAYYGFDIDDEDIIGLEYDDGDDDSDPDFGKKSKKKKKSKGVKAKRDQEHAHGEGDDGGGNESGGALEYSASGRRKRKDTGGTRNTSRSWTDEEERLFLEALSLHGRDWKRCGDHIGTRDHRAVASHCQKYLIKKLLKGEELPDKMAESGRGYTLSGRPLDPNSASAKAYGLRPDAFKKIVESGFLEVGVHVTSLEMSDEPFKNCRTRGGSRSAKRARRNFSYLSGEDLSSDGEEAVCRAIDAAAASTVKMEVAINESEEHLKFNQQPQTEYSRSRPRRQNAGRVHLGTTTESLDLTPLQHFVGPVGTGGALSQPFTVKISAEASLVMDFHAHLSSCEIIGLLGGTFNEEDRVLSVRAAFPCKRAYGSDSGTSVELDAEWQFQVTMAMSAADMKPVGWYHSHPVFEPRPSVKDNENQRNYQALCRLEHSGLEPWVGAIVGPYDQALPSTTSGMQFWVVRQRDRNLVPFHIRPSKSPASVVPEEGSSVENQLRTAIDLHRNDFARIDMNQTWRSYSRLVSGFTDGPSVSNCAKLAAAMQDHLPSFMDNWPSINRFFERLSSYFNESWNIDISLSKAFGSIKNPPEEGDFHQMALERGKGDDVNVSQKDHSLDKDLDGDHKKENTLSAMKMENPESELSKDELGEKVTVDKINSGDCNDRTSTKGIVEDHKTDVCVSDFSHKIEVDTKPINENLDNNRFVQQGLKTESERVNKDNVAHVQVNCSPRKGESRTL